MAYFRNLPKIGYDFNRDGIIQNIARTESNNNRVAHILYM